jgi:hypothetical protein
MVGRGVCSHRGQMASKRNILEIYWGTLTMRGAYSHDNSSRPMPSPQQVVQFVRPTAAPQHADRPVIPAAGTMPGSFEAEMAVEHCSDGAGVVSGDYLPRAAGCCSVSGFDLRLDHHGLCALL